ncbi:MAG: alpha/beta fold hydrolase BchO [Sphingomonadaceae bacterium]
MSDRPDWDREGADWPNRAASRFVKAAGLTLHVQIMGAGPALLLLHGTGAATHSWRALMPLLAEGFTVIAPDLPGHGFTRGVLADGATLPSVARGVAALMTALEVNPAVIVGHSAGAAIAIRMALDRLAAPRALVGLSAALLPFPGLAAQLFPTLAKLLFLNPFAPHIFARMAQSPGEVGRFLPRATGSTIDAAGVASYARLFAKAGHIRGTISMMASWDLDALKRDLPRLTVPLLLAHGERDSAIPIATVRDATALIPGARFESLGDLGHLAHEERPDLVAALIAKTVGEVQCNISA